MYLNLAVLGHLRKSAVHTINYLLKPVNTSQIILPKKWTIYSYIQKQYIV